MPHNTMLDVTFTVIHEMEDPMDLFKKENIHLVLNALQKRIDYLRENLSDAPDSFGVYETVTDDPGEPFAQTVLDSWGKSRL